LIFLATSLGHATTEIVEEVFVFADAFDVDRIAAAKAGSHACAGAIREAPNARSFLQAQWLGMAPETERLSGCA